MLIFKKSIKKIKNGGGFIQAPSSIRRSGAGFTLIEILVVIAIIGILSSLTTVAFVETRKNAKITVAQADLRQLRTAIDMMAIDTEKWPGHQHIDRICIVEDPPNCDPGIDPGPCCDPSINELCGDNCDTNTISSGFAGISQTDGNYLGWDGPYIVNIPLDPWGNEYFFDSDYDIDGEWRAVVGSYGPDGKEKNGYQNSYDEDDIILTVGWQL